MSEEEFTVKLTVYKPAAMAGPGEQVGFEYDLTIAYPDSKAAMKVNHAQAVTANHARASSARCEVVPVTGTLSLPNPAVPIISPFRGSVFIYDNSPIIGFPLVMMANSTEETLKFELSLAFYPYSGAITFGEWPGPFSNVTASFLGLQSPIQRQNPSR